MFLADRLLRPALTPTAYGCGNVRKRRWRENFTGGDRCVSPACDFCTHRLPCAGDVRAAVAILMLAPRVWARTAQRVQSL